MTEQRTRGDRHDTNDPRRTADAGRGAQTKAEPQQSSHFPPVVREWLKLAARPPKPQDRVEAIELAEKMARRNYPELFRT